MPFFHLGKPIEGDKGGEYPPRIGMALGTGGTIFGTTERANHLKLSLTF